MERLDTTARSNLFVAVGCFAIVAALALIPALTSVAAHLNPWAAIAVVTILAGLLCLAVIEAWKYLST